MNTGISPKQDDASNSNLLNIGQDHSLQYQGLEHNDSHMLIRTQIQTTMLMLTRYLRISVTCNKPDRAKTMRRSINNNFPSFTTPF
ncbi:BPK_HP2_G0031390.mRNA.1.CDS.1 [Saccharomyces cerevisiae]|nr:AIG_G0033160.mRNA.1.CDS.1 [Saccharomyces cerevisiae]CAI5293566.1 BPK_HP2_G0031390.mRNA.1.CDS.1 [Saccharomyces cerevisiae]CAI5298840.1 ASB_HP2_G0033880.mRNA.1.CDS.1 [Saccharomyces cerevisiae]CAI6581867.1 BPK_HP1_G0032830.mRNA.1.CDS.1 [Saccharomyces cerevisiae]CAI6611125.1 BPK_HP2_G0031390.mRNA.1.CDS.1 [Saccharomyces cerevisiae]